MAFALGKNSLSKLSTVDKRLWTICQDAIKITRIDFGVICGKRTLAEQEALLAKGATQTMKSKHLDGLAVDLMAYINGRASWELNLYDDIADAMKEASRKNDIPIWVMFLN